jgi:hypothetical protein
MPPIFLSAAWATGLTAAAYPGFPLLAAPRSIAAPVAMPGLVKRSDTIGVVC